MQELEPGQPTLLADTTVPVRRILGRNPGPMTGPGTNTYLIGSERLCLLDPGPRDDIQFDVFMAAIGDARLDYILATHTHGDHSPGAQRLQEATDAELVGMPPPDVPGHDRTFQPARQWRHDDVLDCGSYSLRLLHTPGHVSNHICYLLEQDRMLFTGDHVLQGSTPVILAPDGNMTDYLNALAWLKTLDLKSLAPGHGHIMTNPSVELDKLIAHRLQREQKIVRGLEKLGPCDMDTLVLDVYDDVSRHLIPWARKTLMAHLLKLERDGRARSVGPDWQLL